ncbi:MAG: hypothetical protein GY903_34400 [Fuerstiella sp.]|nr:hypothetical protein [Fuerstiella sp.]MCP4859583.1 hypothetical protein [Fuerstiella sp.]
MNINLSPDQQAFIDDLVQSGRFASTDEAISECVQLLVSREYLRQQIGIGIQQADQDNLTDHDTVFGNLRRRAAELQASSREQ